jgi:hypothetical protein
MTEFIDHCHFTEFTVTTPHFLAELMDCTDPEAVFATVKLALSALTGAESITRWTCDEYIGWKINHADPLPNIDVSPYPTGVEFIPDIPHEWKPCRVKTNGTVEDINE